MTFPDPAVTAEGYRHALADLYGRQQALAEALDRADQCTDPVEYGAALSELHTHNQGMAAVANHALGGLPTGVPVPQ